VEVTVAEVQATGREAWSQKKCKAKVAAAFGPTSYEPGKRKIPTRRARARIRRANGVLRPTDLAGHFWNSVSDDESRRPIQSTTVAMGLQ
jgi:hypothetical protein